MKLLTTNTKLLKGEGIPCFGLSLAPHNLSGYNVCPMASDKDTPANLPECLDILECGGAVAIPFQALARKHEALPETWQGYPVVDGDVDDRIWNRSKGGLVVGLRFKGDTANIDGGCKDYCIYASGHGRFDSVKGARLFRTRLLMESRKLFFDQLTQELDALTQKHPTGFAVRMNVFSDLAWESSGWSPSGTPLMKLYPKVTWYDYTKIPKRVHQYLAGTLESNYHLVFSYNKTWKDA
ncbi:MAG TPA: hypothetical protein VM141_12435 [Planctomycetota bacterium]|nr:hypothetical protein [Planctomycetota bacterium]